MKKTIYILTILFIISNFNLVFAENNYNTVVWFDNLETLTQHLLDEGYLINHPEDIRTITGSYREDLEQQNYLRQEGFMIKKISDGFYMLFLDTENKPERIEPKPIEVGEQKGSYTGCIKTEKINNFNEVRNFVENTISKEEILNFYTNAESSFKTDLNLLRDNLEKQEVPEDEIQYVLSVHTDEYIKPNIDIDLRRLQEGAIGTSIIYNIEGYKVYKDKDYYTICYLQGGSRDNPDYIINRDNPEEFFNILEDIKARIDYQFNLRDSNGRYWLRDLHVGTGDIRVNFSDHPNAEIGYFHRMQDNIITQPEWMENQITEALTMYDTLVINSMYHEISPEILANSSAINYIPHTEERYVIGIVDDIIPPTPEEPKEPEMPEIPENPTDPNDPNTPNNPNNPRNPNKPDDKPTLSKDTILKKVITIISIIIITTISIIVILYILFSIVAHKLPLMSKIPFIPLFYHTRKVSIYSNLKQEDGTIKRKKVFSEGYEVNGTQLIVDITDTMSMYKEYNYLEIEIPQDIAYSVIVKTIDDKEVEEVIPRVLVVTHKNHDEPIQIITIAENFYNEEENVFIIKLDV